MRGIENDQSAMFSYLSPEQRVPMDHPLRSIRGMCDVALGPLTWRFSRLYSKLGRRSVPPEKLLRALLLQILYSIRSERMLMEQVDYNLLFRWFVGLNMDEEVWDPTVFSKNRDRLLRGNLAQGFLAAVVAQARHQDLLSDDHFSVDGSLLEAWASKDSYQPKENPPTEGTGSRGELLLRDTHECRTDPDARMFRKNNGSEYKLCHMVHVLMENRNGLPVAGRASEATTDAESKMALAMLAQVQPPGRRITVGADTGYDYAGFVDAARAQGVTPHVVQHTKKASAIDGRTTRWEGYDISLQKRKRVEQIFGWLKTTGMMRKLRHRGRALVEWMFTFALAAYNLVRMRTIAFQSAKA